MAESDTRTVDEIWENLSPGRRALARDLATSVLEGVGLENLAAQVIERGSKAAAFKLWFLIWRRE